MKRRGLDFRSVSRAELDYTQPAVLEAELRKQKPDFLINCAGYTGKPNVDACELHKAECLQANAVLPGTIDRVCGELDLSWGQVSSGCIYTGSKSDGRGFSETDPPNFSFRQNNCSFYSGCKALGEEVLSGSHNSYIWRLRIPFDEVDGRRNYLTKLQSYDRLLDATNSLSHLGEFVSSCLYCLENFLPFGIYNVTNPGFVTTHEVVELIETIRPSGKAYRFFDDEAQFMQLAAQTPRSNCVLDTTKAQAAGLPLSPVKDALQQALQGWQARC